MGNYANDTIKETTNENEKSAKKPKVIITGDGINEKGLSQDNCVKIKHFPGETTETILEEVEEVVKNKPDTFTAYAGNNDLRKMKNVLNNVKKIIKSVKKFSLQTKLVFSSRIVRKNKNNINKEVLDTNARLRTLIRSITPI